MLMDGLALEIVVGMRLAIGAGDRLRSFIGFEAQIALLVSAGAGIVAEAGIAEHQIVIGLEILGIDGKRLLKFFHGISVALLEEEDATEFVVDDAVARILRQHLLKNLDGFVIFAFVFEQASVEIVRASQAGLESQRFQQHHFRATGVAFLQADAADVGPAVKIVRRQFGDFGESLLRADQIALKKEADAVIVPAGPIVLDESDLWGGDGSRARKDVKGSGIFGDGDDGNDGDRFDFSGYIGSIFVVRPLAVVVILGNFSGIAFAGDSGKGE